MQGWGVEPPNKFSKGGRLDRISQREVAGLLGGGGGGCRFYMKNKLKSEIFNNKCFSLS